jgi:hypothetical protein
LKIHCCLETPKGVGTARFGTKKAVKMTPPEEKQKTVPAQGAGPHPP